MPLVDLQRVAADEAAGCRVVVAGAQEVVAGVAGGAVGLFAGEEPVVGVGAGLRLQGPEHVEVFVSVTLDSTRVTHSPAEGGMA